MRKSLKNVFKYPPTLEQEIFEKISVILVEEVPEYSFKISTILGKEVHDERTL